MAEELSNFHKESAKFSQLLQFFTDAEVEKLFRDRTELAMNKSSISQLTSSEIRGLQKEIDILAAEIKERKMDMSARPLLRKPKNPPMRFSDEHTRKKINVLDVFYRAERQKQRRAEIIEVRSNIAKVKDFLITPTKKSRSESPIRKIDLVVVGKAIKIKETPEKITDKNAVKNKTFSKSEEKTYTDDTKNNEKTKQKNSVSNEPDSKKDNLREVESRLHCSRPTEKNKSKIKKKDKSMLEKNDCEKPEDHRAHLGPKRKINHRKIKQKSQNSLSELKKKSEVKNNDDALQEKGICDNQIEQKNELQKAIQKEKDEISKQKKESESTNNDKITQEINEFIERRKRELAEKHKKSLKNTAAKEKTPVSYKPDKKNIITLYKL